MNIANLNSFLRLGYFLDYRRPGLSIDTSGVNKTKYQSATTQQLIEIGTELLREAITVNYSSSEDILVPISGGLDSRAILAGLIEHRDAARIHTYTFGTPGTWDFDIGCEVARRLGTQHHVYDLTQVIYSQDELEDVSRRIDQQAILFHHWPVWEVDRDFHGSSNWSGFAGGELHGAHLPRSYDEQLEKAEAQFLERNTYVQSVRLHTSVEISSFLEVKGTLPQHLTIEENLDLTNRQPKFIAPIVLMRGYEHKTPFLYQPWIDFSLSLDNERHRRHQRLYKSILQNAFPELFSWRTKTNGGLTLDANAVEKSIGRLQRRLRGLFGRQSHNINYIDFDEGIRNRDDLRKIVVANLNDLDRRQLLPHISPMDLLHRHINRAIDCADALIALTSLEIHLKTGKVL